LREAGYRTELIGVHHESRRQSDDRLAERLGFDQVRTGGLVDQVVERGTETIRRLAEADQPFYLQLGFQEPHRLMGKRDAPGVHGFLGDHLEPDSERGVEVPPYLEDTPQAREEIAELQGSIKAMDAGVGELLATLDSTGRADETLVIFTTDHGLALPRAKCSLHDPGLEVAFLLRWPAAGWTGGVRLGELLINIDVLPTLLELLQLEPGGGEPISGRSFLPLLQDRPDDLERREVIFGELTYHDYYDPRRSARTERHKLILSFSSSALFMDPSQSWVRRCVPVGTPNGNIGSHPPVQLYDLATDPLELTNVADHPDYAEVRTQLLNALREWMESTGDPLLEGAVTSPQHRDATAALTP
jgi:arylsulfatase A-like enzyme